MSRYVKYSKSRLWLHPSLFLFFILAKCNFRPPPSGFFGGGGRNRGGRSLSFKLNQPQPAEPDREQLFKPSGGHTGTDPQQARRRKGRRASADRHDADTKTPGRLRQKPTRKGQRSGAWRKSRYHPPKKKGGYPRKMATPTTTSLFLNSLRRTNKNRLGGVHCGNAVGLLNRCYRRVVVVFSGGSATVVLFC